MIQVQIINKSPHAHPSYQTSGSAGMDIRAWLPETIVLKPLERKIIPTGLYMALPIGYEAQVRPRSGLAIKRGLTVVNAPGTIDSDYRGEVKVGIINLSAEDQMIEDGERIAQLIVAQYTTICWETTENLSDTERGTGGFGHSGTK